MSLSAKGLVGKAVRWRGLRLGSAVDVLFDDEARKALGIEVLCEGGGRGFAPFAVLELNERAIGLDSPLALVGADGLSFYRQNGRSFATWTNDSVREKGRVVGVLEDVLLGSDGIVRGLLVRNGETVLERPVDGLDLTRTS